MASTKEQNVSHRRYEIEELQIPVDLSLNGLGWSISRYERGSEESLKTTLYNEEVTCQAKLAYGWICHDLMRKIFINTEYASSPLSLDPLSERIRQVSKRHSRAMSRCPRSYIPAASNNVYNGSNDSSGFGNLS